MCVWVELNAGTLVQGAISSRSTQGLGHSPSAPDARAPSGPDRHLCHFMFIRHLCSWCGSKLRHFWVHSTGAQTFFSLG